MIHLLTQHLNCPKVIVISRLIFNKKKSSFCLETVNEVEVLLLLENLDGKKSFGSFGVDKLHPYLASIVAFEIFRPVTYIINLSLKQCVYPDNLKIAKVIPIFKQILEKASNIKYLGLVIDHHLWDHVYCR